MLIDDYDHLPNTGCASVDDTAKINGFYGNFMRNTLNVKTCGRAFVVGTYSTGIAVALGIIALKHARGIGYSWGYPLTLFRCIPTL